MNFVRTIEYGAQSFEYLPCDVERPLLLRLLVKFRVVVIELPLDLSHGTDESYAIHIGHDRLFDNLPGDSAVKGFGDLDALRRVLRHSFLNEFGYTRVDVRRPIGGFEIDLLSASSVTTKRSIVLKTVAGTILVDWKTRWVFGRVGIAQGIAKFAATSRAP